MKTIYLLSSTLLLFSFVGKTQTADVSSYDEKILNWQSKDVSRKTMGTNTYKAYEELLKGKSPKKSIVVAVIDAGIDVNHEDLKDNIWVNKKEIPGNGIDDDNNGYIDDINGWNFLGNLKGENLDKAPLEITRLYRKLHAKFENKSKSEIAEAERKDFAEYQKMKVEISKKKTEAEQQFLQMKQLYSFVSDLYDSLGSMEKTSATTFEEVKSITTSTKPAKKLKRRLVFFGKMGLTKEGLKEGLNHFEAEKTAYYNLDFTPREDIIGDNTDDIRDYNYGNNDVTGPDAFHGTFCAGIIGATQNNSIGIDGISNNVLLMSLRAVPNGDEYDKDIALAIRYAVDNGAKVINMSFGKAHTANKSMVDDAFKYAEENGVLLVHAAGNDNKNIDTTNNFPSDKLLDNSKVTNLICVGASTYHTKKKLPAGFSNFGNENVDLFAPGQDIVSTDVGNTYQVSQGTSFAAPVVSGVAALVWSYYPDLTVAQLKEILLKSATNKGKKKVRIPGSKKKVRFKELSVSDGVVNTYNALKLAEEMSK